MTSHFPKQYRRQPSPTSKSSLPSGWWLVAILGILCCWGDSFGRTLTVPPSIGIDRWNSGGSSQFRASTWLKKRAEYLLAYRKKAAKRPMSTRAVATVASNPAQWSAEELEAIRLRNSRRMADRDRVRGFIDSSNLISARYTCEQLLLESPDSPLIVPEFIDLCIREGRYAEGLAIASPHITNRSSDRIRLRAAFLFALYNFIEPEQLAYVRGMTLQSWASHAGVQEAVPNVLSRSGLMSASLLAIGVSEDALSLDRSALYYLGRFLEFYPQNPLAHNRMGTILLRRQECERAEFHFRVSLIYATADLRRDSQAGLNSAMKLRHLPE